MRIRMTPLFAVAALTFFASVSEAQAKLNAVDPGPYTAAFGKFPVWYQDTNGRALELCLGGPGCLPPVLPDPTLPMSFPGNFPDELFWFTGEAAVAGSGVALRYISALEAAFATGDVLDGAQISFARIRFVADVQTAGTYTITHPYGVNVFEIDAANVGPRAIFFTEDIGIGAAGDFTGALKGGVGPFLVQAGFPRTLGDGKTYIGDPAVAAPVTGSPFGTNFVRIQGPGGIDLRTDNFAVSGLVYQQILPSPLVIDRTTYSRTALQTQVDVFATSAPTATLSFTPPPGAPMGPGDAVGRFFGQALGGLSPTVDVSAAANAALNTSAVTKSNAVVDVVTITKAEYSNGILTIQASSSDETNPPVLNLGATRLVATGPGATQSATVSLAIPPATLTVTSSAGGSDTEDVVVLP
jgi:hypothetical protein